MADGMFSMFDPNAYQQQRAQEAQKAAMAYAQQTPQQRTDAAGYGFGGALAGGVRSLLGVEDKGLMQVKQAQEAMRGVDRNDPEQLYAKAYEMREINPQFGEALWKEAERISGVKSKAGLEAAQTKYELARAETAGIEKKSTADVAQMKDKLSTIEQDLLEGKPVSEKDMAYARSALVQLKQGKVYQDKEGRIIQVPGIIPGEFAPRVAAKLFGGNGSAGGGAAPAQGSWNTSNPAATLKAIATIKDPEEQKAALSSFTQALQGGGAPSSGAGGAGVTVTELPKSSQQIQAEQQKAQSTVKTLDTALANVDVALKRITPWSTGYGSLLKSVPTSDAMALNDIVKSLQSESVFSQLSTLKEQSKTGASGLGSVTEKEIGLLEARIRSLNPASKTFVEDLKFVQKTWQELRGKAQGKTGAKINWNATVQNLVNKGMTTEQAEAELNRMGYSNGN